MRRDVCLHIADSLLCTAEANTMLKSNYNSVKRKKERKTDKKLHQRGGGYWTGIQPFLERMCKLIKCWFLKGFSFRIVCYFQSSSDILHGVESDILVAEGGRVNCPTTQNSDFYLISLLGV